MQVSGIQFVPDLFPVSCRPLTAAEVNAAVAAGVLHTVVLAGLPARIDAVAASRPVSTNSGDGDDDDDDRDKPLRVDVSLHSRVECTDPLVAMLASRLGCDDAVAVVASAMDMVQTASPRDLQAGPMSLRCGAA